MLVHLLVIISDIGRSGVFRQVSLCGNQIDYGCITSSPKDREDRVKFVGGQLSDTRKRAKAHTDTSGHHLRQLTYGAAPLTITGAARSESPTGAKKKERC